MQIDPSGAAKGEGLKAEAPCEGAIETTSACDRRRLRDEEIPNELRNRQARRAPIPSRTLLASADGP